MLLFGIIISSTDPVAVLAIFKEFGVPKRIYLLFEGESLFNDGTSVALFMILLSVILSEGSISVSTMTLSFFGMIIGGVIIGVLIGILFSKAIKYVKFNEQSEITLTMVIAHLSFLVCEYLSQVLAIDGFSLHISGVIATAYTAIVIGNYGKTKITPQVEKYMSRFWDLFTFVCNSLVFLLMGMLLVTVQVPIKALLVPIGISLVIVLVGRVVAVG